MASDTLRARWEFGQQMLAARDGAGRLPNGYLTALASRTTKSRSELKYRAQFAAAYSEEDLANALALSPSWREVAKSLKSDKDAEDNLVTTPPVALDGTFSTFVAEPPWRYGSKVGGVTRAGKRGGQTASCVGRCIRSVNIDSRVEVLK